MSKCGKKSSKCSSKKVCYTGDAVSGSTCDYKAKGCSSEKEKKCSKGDSAE